MMRAFARILAAGLLWACLAAPAAALTPQQLRTVQQSNACRGVFLQLGLAGNTPTCYRGERLSGPASVPGWSFSRGSAETCLWADGHFTTASSGVPCFTDLGMGFWEGRTNLFLNSFAPVTQTITLGATGKYTLSVWGAGSVAVAAGTATISGAGTASSGTPVTINCTVTGTVTLTVTSSPTAVNFEAGAFWTPPIQTTGSTATRAADALSIANSNTSSNVTYWGKVYRPAFALGTLGYIADQGLNKTAIDMSGNDFFQANLDGLGSPSSAGGLQSVGFHKFAASFAQGHQITALDGGYGNIGVSTWTEGSATTLFVGQSHSNITQLNGYLSSLSLVARTLPDDQVRRLSQ